MIFRAKQLIEEHYVYKPRKSKSDKPAATTKERRFDTDFGKKRLNIPQNLINLFAAYEKNEDRVIPELNIYNENYRLPDFPNKTAPFFDSTNSNKTDLLPLRKYDSELKK